MGLFVKEGRLRPVWRVILYIPAYWLSVIVWGGLFILAYYIVVLLRSGGRFALSFNPEEIPLFIWIALSILILGWTWFVTWAFRALLDREPLLSLGLRLRLGWLRQSIVGFVLFSPLALVWNVIPLWVGSTGIVGFAWEHSSGLHVAFSILGLTVFAGATALGEELAFRGYILQNLLRVGRPFWGAAISSIVFAVFHILNPGMTWVDFIYFSLVGGLFAYAYLVTRQLWLPLSLHFAALFVNLSIFDIPGRGGPTGGLIQMEISDFNVWSGGGVAGSYVGLVDPGLPLVALLILWAVARRGILRSPSVSGEKLP